MLGKKRSPITRFLEESVEELYPDLKTLQEELLNCYTQTILLEKYPKTTLSLKGHLLEDLGRNEEYIEICHQVLKLKPDDANNWWKLYWNYKEKGDYEKALNFFEEYEKYHYDVKADEFYQKAEILEKLG